MTKVVNSRIEPYDVYIGRGSLWGNPYPIDRNHSREEVIELFRFYFNNKIETNEEFRQATLKLKGRTLGCFCKPLACHGDVILDYLNEHSSQS